MFRGASKLKLGVTSVSDLARLNLLRMKNEEHYKEIPLQKKYLYSPLIFSRYGWIYGIGNLLVILLGPMLSKYNRVILSPGDYMRLWSLSALVVLGLNIIFLWLLELRPYLDKRKGFYWRGKFTVIGKETSFGSSYLELNPGKSHRIKVRSEFYHSVHVQDRIVLERSYLGDLMKIKKISSIMDRIKRREELSHVD